jgi:putative acetyltransferase
MGRLELLGCGALKEVSPVHGEIKSMRTVTAHLCKGVGRPILERLVSVVKERGYTRLSFETKKDASFANARVFL